MQRGFVIRLTVLLAALLAVIWTATTFVATPWVVAGPSMKPTLEDGDRVLVDLWTLGRRPPKVGEVVLLEAPSGHSLVKRVGDLADDGWIQVFGDNPSRSRDSRHFGAVAPEAVAGRVFWRYWPPSRFGPIRNSPPSPGSAVESPAGR